MVFEYIPKGVCSQKFTLDINEDGTIESLHVIGGCNGNLKGIAQLVDGMKAEEVIKKIKGTKCGFKNTSCPDQLATALEEALKG